MKVKTMDLSGVLLRWAVARAERLRPRIGADGEVYVQERPWRPDEDWSIGGPILEREGIDLIRNLEHWTSFKVASVAHPHIRKTGMTPLVAAMRVWVTMRYGPELDVPAELGAPRQEHIPA